jgi:ADP-ribose pyrophosphatase YjhB (NUDIX family)
MNDRPTEVLVGERVGRQGQLRLGCAAVLFDRTRENILLTRRSDNGQWCLPGGAFDPGESVAEGCEREVFEETGLQVKVVRLAGVYSNPDQLIVYPDGNKVHVYVLCFEVRRVGGELGLSDETTGAQFIPVKEAVQMDLFHGHSEFIRDILTGNERVFIR